MNRQNKCNYQIHAIIIIILYIKIIIIKCWASMKCLNGPILKNVSKWPKWHVCKWGDVSVRVKVNLGGPRVVPNGPSISKSYPKNEWKNLSLN